MDWVQFHKVFKIHASLHQISCLQNCGTPAEVAYDLSSYSFNTRYAVCLQHNDLLHDTFPLLYMCFGRLITNQICIAEYVKNDTATSWGKFLVISHEKII